MATTRDRAGMEAAVRLVERFLIAYVAGDPETMGEVVTEDCVVHQVRWPKATVGRETLVADAAEMDTFTDVTITVEEAVVNGDRVAAYVTASDRNVDPVRMEGREIAPTGWTLGVPQFGLYRPEDDRVVEAWLNVEPVESGTATDASLVGRVRVWLRAD